MEPQSKKRRMDRPVSRSCRMGSSPAAKGDGVPTSANISTVPTAQSSGIQFRIEQAKRYAVAQAQQEGCTANFRILDSPFGNFLLPVIPTRAELNR